MSLKPGDHDLPIASPWSLGERAGLVVLVFLVPAILVLDFVAGREISLHFFYVVPVALAAWVLGQGTGIAIAAAAGASWAFVALASRAPDQSAFALAWDIAATFALFAFVAFVVARHRRFVDGLHALARVDAQTGALARREFDRVLEAEARRARRYKRPLALVLLELGPRRNEPRRFLEAASRTLRDRVREGDSVALVAPRRFGIVLIECRAPEPALVVERLREGLKANLQAGDADLAVSVVLYGGGAPTSGAELLAAAIRELGFAKPGAPLAQVRLD